MEKVERYIKEHIRYCSNSYWDKNCGDSNYPWLTPDEARKVAEIAREEMISKLRKWVSSKNERDSFTFGYIERHFDELLKQVMRDENTD